MKQMCVLYSLQRGVTIVPQWALGDSPVDRTNVLPHQAKRDDGKLDFSQTGFGIKETAIWNAPAFCQNQTVFTTLKIDVLCAPNEPTQAPSKKCARVTANASDTAKQTKTNVLEFAKPSPTSTRRSTLPLRPAYWSSPLLCSRSFAGANSANALHQPLASTALFLPLGHLP